MHYTGEHFPRRGFQIFGEVEIDGRAAAMTVTLRDATGAAPWPTELPPH